jgi:hypothetical protein
MFVVADRKPARTAKVRGYPTADAAEKAARRIVRMTGKDIGIWLRVDSGISREVACVVRDALDRVWTDVLAAPGQQTFL